MFPAVFWWFSSLISSRYCVLIIFYTSQRVCLYEQVVTSSRSNIITSIFSKSIINLLPTNQYFYQSPWPLKFTLVTVTTANPSQYVFGYGGEEVACILSPTWAVTTISGALELVHSPEISQWCFVTLLRLAGWWCFWGALHFLGYSMTTYLQDTMNYFLQATWQVCAFTRTLIYPLPSIPFVARATLPCLDPEGSFTIGKWTDEINGWRGLHSNSYTSITDTCHHYELADLKLLSTYGRLIAVLSAPTYCLRVDLGGLERPWRWLAGCFFSSPVHDVLKLW